MHDPHFLITFVDKKPKPPRDLSILIPSYDQYSFPSRWWNYEKFVV